MPTAKNKSSGKTEQKRTKRRWLADENIKVLEFLSETIKQGYSIEKPNALKYYQKLIDETGLTNCTPDLVKNKVRNFQTTYVAALAWQRNTGQGIKETDGEASFQDVLHHRYPYLKLMEEIWGEKSNIIPPFVVESAEDQNETIENYLIDDNGNVLELSQDDGQDVGLQDVDSQAVGLQAVGSRAACLQVNTSQDDDSLVAGVRRASKKLLKAIDHKNVTAKSAYEELMMQREESVLLKIKMQEAQLEFDKQRFQDISALERMRFDFEKAKWQSEIELKQKELEVKELQIKADRDIRLKELEVESLKLSSQAK